MEEKLAKLLFYHRITPQSTTETSPAQLLFGCNLKSCLDLLKEQTVCKLCKDGLANGIAILARVRCS